jgi:hypothetical protein
MATNMSEALDVVGPENLMLACQQRGRRGISRTGASHSCVRHNGGVRVLVFRKCDLRRCWACPSAYSTNGSRDADSRRARQSPPDDRPPAGPSFFGRCSSSSWSTGARGHTESHAESPQPSFRGAALGAPHGSSTCANVLAATRGAIRSTSYASLLYSI